MDDDQDEGIQEAQEGSPSGLKKVFTIRNSTARQVAIKFMPSRQISYNNTIKVRRSNSADVEFLDRLLSDDGCPKTDQQADLFVKEMEQDQRLMEDDPEAENLRREALRVLPQNLTMKRTVRAKLSLSVSLRSKRRPLSYWKRFKYRVSFAMKKAMDRLSNMIYVIDIWYNDIKKIEGNFGSAVGSYFHFLRSLFIYNLLLLILVMSFVVVPQIIHDVRVDTHPEVVEDDSNGFLDFISGKGLYENSTLFYGRYYNGNVSGSSYSMPFAYFYTMGILYIGFFAVLCYRTAYLYRKNFIETSGRARHVFSSKVFSGWDFGIASKRAAALNARNNYIELKELMAEQNRKQKTMSFWVQIWHLFVNFIAMILVLSIISAVEYGFYSLLTQTTFRWSHYELIVSLIVTIIVSCSPIFFTFINKFEFYQPRTALYVILARTFLMDMGTVILLLVFYFQTGLSCSETAFGQETYRLVVLDAVISLILLPCFEFTRGILHRMFPSSTSAPTFSLASNSLTLLYNQALLWAGLLFSPLLVAALLVKMLLLFYVKKAVTLYACVPARKVWRAAQTQTVMMVLVVGSMFVTIFAHGSLFLKSSSKTCGPFTQYEYVYNVLTEGTLNLSQNRGLNTAISLLLRPGAIALIMVLLGTVVYYMRARAMAQRSMVELLKQMLVLEAKDKDFLLSAIAKVSNGEWLYSPRDDDPVVPNSHTWKYLNDDNIRKPSNSAYHFDGSRLHQSHDASRFNQSALDTSRERPTSYNSQFNEDGETDSSFSWQGSNGNMDDSTIDNEKRKSIQKQT